ncbi:hypothetical protein [Methylomarinum vadi]|uniref:hypothetical protein n=1 Tax=Methylomarinum vadi TaxID=438855 RepID=UPI0004DFACAC|nr:hypothetical protein [Methylomarinum vadi]
MNLIALLLGKANEQNREPYKARATGLLRNHHVHRKNGNGNFRFPILQNIKKVSHKTPDASFKGLESGQSRQRVRVGDRPL